MGLVHVAGVPCPLQLGHGVVGQLQQVLMGLSPQVSVQLPKDDQC